MARALKVHLAHDERFRLWGRLISKLVFTEGTSDDARVSMYAHDGFVGTAVIGNLPEVMNVINDRRHA
jgi:hypothetical protein